MAEYISAYTGEEIDSGINKAGTALQPEALQTILSGYQKLLQSGVNIKTINNTSILGEGNIEIQGGGGASIRIVDATNPEDWDGESPTQSCLLDILANTYQVIYIDNVPTDEEGMEAGLSMYLLSRVDIDNDGDEYHVRQYVRFDDGDGEEPAIQTFLFEKEGDDDAEMEVASYDLGGGGDAPIWITSFSSYINGTTGEIEFTIYNNGLSELSDAIDNDEEVVLRVNGCNYDDNKFFRISAYDRNGRTYIQDWDESLYFPDFVCETPYGQYFAELDHIEPSLNYAVYKVVEGAKRYQPTDIKLSTNMIQFDSDDLTQLWNQKRPEITVNVDDNLNETNWVSFKKVTEDLTQGAEKLIYSSDIIPDSSHLFYYQIKFNMNNGDIETSIYKYEISASTV